ncbi:MAG TPA: response regulator [Rhodothermales bacterium]
MKVLIVDDSPAIIESLLDILQHMGGDDVKVISATNTKDAMKIFHEEEPDLVMMDMKMPPGDGEKTALQMLKVRPKLRLVVMTGLQRTAPEVESLVSAGAYDVLQKPIRVDRLQEIFRLIDQETKKLRRVS